MRIRRNRDILAIAALRTKARRTLYEYVVSSAQPVSRDEAAEAVGIGRPLAAFHLDRLVAEGLLEASFRRLGVRGVAGAGRPSKLYQRARAEVSVSLPPRDYEFAAQLLLKALAARPSGVARASLDEAAREAGEMLGREARQLCGVRPTTGRLREAAVNRLEERGYEPYVDSAGVLRLRNCPFHSLPAHEPQLVCGMNVALIKGLISGLGIHNGSEAILDPGAHVCCAAVLGWA